MDFTKTQRIFFRILKIYERKLEPLINKGLTSDSPEYEERKAIEQTRASTLQKFRDKYCQSPINPFDELGILLFVTLPMVEEAGLGKSPSDTYKEVYADVLELHKNNSDLPLPPPPPVIANSMMGLQSIQRWYIVAMKQQQYLETTSGGKAEKTITVTPETDSNLIYQADAAELYNVPKATLSKAANKKTGDMGYLWSGCNGKRVFYRKSDIEKLSRSRARLSK